MSTIYTSEFTCTPVLVVMLGTARLVLSRAYTKLKLRLGWNHVERLSRFCDVWEVMLECTRTSMSVVNGSPHEMKPR